MKINTHKKATVGLFGLFALVSSCFSEVALEPKGMQIEIRDSKPVKPELTEVPKPGNSVGGPVQKTEKKVQIRSFDVSGNFNITTEDLLAAAGNLAGATPVSVGYEDLQSMAQRMTALYRQRGFAVAVVQLSAQEVTDGRIIFTAIEGRLDSFNVSSRSREAMLHMGGEAAINSAIPEQRRDALRLADAERAVLLAGELTNSQSEALLVPGANLGTTELQVQLTPKENFTGSVQLDNSGTDTTGKQQLAATLTKRNFIALGDALDASVLTSEATTRLNSYGLNYSTPVGSDGWKVGARLSRVNYSLGGSFESLNYRGMATQTGMSASYPLLRRFESQMDVRLTYNQVELVDKRGESVLAASNRYADVSTAELRGSFSDQLIGTGAFNDWSTSLKSGWLQFGTPSQKLTDAANNQLSGEFQAQNFSYKTKVVKQNLAN